MGCGEGLHSGPGSAMVPPVSLMENNNADLRALCSGNERVDMKAL